MPVNLGPSFDAFERAVSLPQNAIRRIESASATLSAFLVQRLGLTDDEVFLQGSYPNGTAIRPVDGGEYDVDVIAVMADLTQGADEALDELETLLRGDGRYRGRIVAKKPCIRLEFAEDDIGKFHVDVVPVRRTGQMLPPLDSPRRGDGWHGTAPSEYTMWCTIQGPRFARTVKALKRWRDEQQAVRHAVKSIVLQVLVAEYMPDEPDDALRLAGTIQAMHTALSGMAQAPVVTNPVLRSENLAARWTVAAFKDFVAELDEARGHSQTAVTTTDRIEAVDSWREVLGESFPAAAPAEFGITLGDDSHAKSASAKGWVVNLDPRYGVWVTADVGHGRRSPYMRRYPDTKPLLFHGKKLRFRANTRGPGDVEVWWQVANTGQHARSVAGLRGEYFQGRDPHRRTNPDPRETWEDTAYTGAHWIRAVLVKDGRVVAESPKFVVNIYNRGHMFRL